MTRLMRPVALVVLLVSLTLPVAADQAKSWFEKGQDAEARQNYEKAYDDYKQDSISLRGNADTILRNRLVASLSARFNSPVELDSLHLDTTSGLRLPD